MAGWMACPECGAAIRFQIPDEQVCSSCGWSEERVFKKQVQEACMDLDENYFKLLEEFGDDKAIASFLHADDPEEYRSLFHEFGDDPEVTESYLGVLERDD
jgi:hypothetical protein